MVDLSTTYLGLKLRNPLVVSASPLSRKVEIVRQLEQAGAAAIVVYSLFEEQIDSESRILDYHLSRSSHLSAEAHSLFPDYGQFSVGPDAYIAHLQRVKAAVSIPVIGSLNGISSGGWVRYAHAIEEAGADALELNIYDIATDPDLSSAELEERYIQLVRDVRAQVRIPLAVKLSPFFTAIPAMARHFATAGANGLVLFNRFYQPDFDLEHLEVVPHLELSTSHDLLLPMRWIALLYGRVDADFALTSGVHSAHDVLKAMMAGARVAMMASELLAHGVYRIRAILNELETWMVEHEYGSIAEMQGSMSQQAVAEPAAFERANYARALQSFDRWLP